MGETHNPHFYDFSISGRVHGSQNQLCLFLETPGCLKNEEFLERFFKIVFLWSSKCWISQMLTIVEKAGAQNPDEPLNEILKILDMSSWSTRKHEKEIW